MSPATDRRAPDPAREAPGALDTELTFTLHRALHERHAARLPAGHSLEVGGRTGANAAIAIAVVGTERRAHEVFVFARGPGTGLDGPLGTCVDVLDGLLQELIGDDDAFLPLDWEGRPFDGGVVFVRGEVRDYLAEREAAKLLGEDMPPPALP
jgi:hypothetical protein